MSDGLAAKPRYYTSNRRSSRPITAGVHADPGPLPFFDPVQIRTDPYTSLADYNSTLRG